MGGYDWRAWVKLGSGFVATWIASWYAMWKTLVESGGAFNGWVPVIVALGTALWWAHGMLDRTFAPVAPLNPDEPSPEPAP